MAYKLFLVEDEIVTRDGIRTSVDWASAGFQWGGEAPDGELAIALIAEAPPDILITDIKMPFMDGLELSRIVRARYPQTRIVILSGHDEFRYAQEAMQLGVTEYLLKPVGAQELLAALKRIAAQIDRERLQEEQLARLQGRLDDNIDVMRQRFLVDLVTGRLSSSAAVDEARRIGVDLVARSYLALIVRCQAAADLAQLARLEAFHDVRRRVMDCLAGRGDLLVFTKDVEETGIILKGDDAAALQRTAARLADELAQLLRDGDKLVIGVGVGQVAQRLSELPQSFLDAFDAAKAATSRSLAPGPHFTFPSSQLLTVDPTAAVGFLRRGSHEGIDAFLNLHLAPLANAGPGATALVEFLVTDLLVAAGRFVQELGGAIDDILPEREALEALPRTDDALPELRALMRRLLVRALTYRDSHADHTHQMIVHAKAYVDLHLTDEDISLSTVAEQMGWSPSHLSAVFSRVTGETFIEYLTRQRMLKARELLRMTTLPTAAVGQKVGYSNPRYFYAVFRKATGQTPTEFRQSSALSAAGQGGAGR